jgi:prepilin-type N-terminal cleavage/methylation domain-containing protein
MNVMRRNRSNASFLKKVGFTLAEILIALALIAVLAAVLLPAVAGQILKGDAGRVSQDLDAVRSGVEQFLADVHRYPGKYSDLTTKITTVKTDINANVYAAGLVAKWGGPYVSKDTMNATVETGFGGSIQNVFMKVANTNAVDYLTVVITGIAGPDFDRLDAQVDGTGANPRTTGLLRWVSSGGVDSTKFLAVPIQ